MRLLAMNAGKMRVALMLAAVVGQFKMPCSIFQIGLMHQILLDQLRQRAVDRCLIGCIGADLVRDLFAGQRSFGRQ